MTTQLRDGSLSISNPIKALDTFRCHGKRRNNKGAGRENLKIPLAVKLPKVCLEFGKNSIPRGKDFLMSYQSNLDPSSRLLFNKINAIR